MIDWVKYRAQEWGAQMRWLYCGKDGWPPRTTLARLIDEGSNGAAVSRFNQHFPECLSPEALITNNAIKRLAQRHQEMFWIHDVIRGRAKKKAEIMSINVRTYYAWMDEAHNSYVRSSTNAINAQNSQNCAALLALDSHMIMRA